MTPDQKQAAYVAYRAIWRAEAKALLDWEIAERARAALEGPGVLDVSDEENG